MLTGYQCEVIAFVTDGGIICRDCAVKEISSVGVERVERGLSDELRPLIRYELDEINSERAHEHVEYELGLKYEDDSEAWNEAFEGYPEEACDHCGEEIS